MFLGFRVWAESPSFFLHSTNSMNQFGFVVEGFGGVIQDSAPHNGSNKPYSLPEVVLNLNRLGLRAV